jgi:tetratricopeptide (TPR) repeat protein
MYGRAEAIARARVRVDGALAGEGGLVLFTGEPGIGKSRVAEHVAGLAEARGATVVWGRAWESGGAPAYWPWIQVFRGLEMDEDPFAAVGPDLAAGAEHARFRAFDEAVRRLKARAAQAPLALVLDDLHAADPSSLLLLLLLSRELRRSPILVLATCRDAETRLAPEVSVLLGKIAREGDVVALPRLAFEDVREWLLAASPAGGAAQAAEMHRLTEGHPLFVKEALRLGAGPRSQAVLLEGLRAVLDERLSRLSREARGVLEVASVLGREFSAEEIAAASGKSLDDVHRDLHEASAASILAPAAASGRLQFSHLLLRDRLYADVIPSTRAVLHWQAGLTKLARGESAQAAIHHLFEGRSAGQPQRLGEVALAAAAGSLARFAFEDAAQLSERALGVAAESPGALPPRTECQLRLTLAEARLRLGDLARGKQEAAQAAELATRIGAHDLLAQAALVYGTEIINGLVDPKLVALLREALAHLERDDSSVRARLMARLAAALYPPRSADDLPETISLIHASIAMARRLGDDRTLLYVLHFTTTAAVWLISDAEYLSLLRETITLALALDERMALVATYGPYITALLASCQRSEAEAALSAYQALLAELSLTHQQFRIPLLRALLRDIDGDFEEADRLIGEAESMSEQAGVRFRVGIFAQLTLAHFSGRPEPLARDAGHLLPVLTRNSAIAPLAAWLLALTGQPEQARQRLQGSVVDPKNFMAVLGAAETSVLLGDRERALSLYPQLLAYQDRQFCMVGTGNLLGPTALALGDLAALIGRAPEAVRHYDEGIAFCERLGSARLVEVCRRSRAAVLAKVGDGVSERPAAAQPTVATTPITMRREGELWVIERGRAPAVRLRHGKGLLYLRYLIDQPGREAHVLELVGVEHQTGDAGTVLDPRAKAEYRQRLDDLKEELEEAERFGDRGRVARAQEEIEAIAEQLAGAVGLGGRDRRAASDVERARVNVQRRLKDAIDRISAADAGLGRYLGASIKTGIYCSYSPV